jgi:PAS domain S-box-containing protein
MATVFERGHAEGEIGIRHAGGSVRRFFVTARPIDLDGEPGILGMGIDVIEAREAERVLRESEWKFRSVFVAVAEGVLLCDPAAGSIVDLNEAASALFGYARAEIVGRSVGTILSRTPPYTQADAMRGIAAARTGGPQSLDWHCRTKESRLFWAEAAIREAAFGPRTLVLATLRDVTERRQGRRRRISSGWPATSRSPGAATGASSPRRCGRRFARAQRGARGFAVLVLIWTSSLPLLRGGLMDAAARRRGGGLICRGAAAG